MKRHLFAALMLAALFACAYCSGAEATCYHVFNGTTEVFTATTSLPAGNKWVFTGGPCDQTPPPPVGQPIYSNIKYPRVPGSGTRSHVDITKWEDLLGCFSNTDACQNFPGKTGSSPAIQTFPADKTVAVRFTVPSTGRYNGWVGNSTYYEQTVDIAFSKTSEWPAATDVACRRDRVTTGRSGPNFVTYPGTTRCKLEPGTVAYLLLRLSTPRAGTVIWALNYYGGTG